MHRVASAAPSTGANKGASQLPRVFSPAPGLSADDARVTINLHNKATAAWGGRSSSNVAALTKTQTSPFLLVEDANVIPRSSAAESPARRHGACSLLGNRIQEVQLFTLSVGKVYPHVSSLVCGGTGPRSTQQNKGGILPYSKEQKQTGAECSAEREEESWTAWTAVLNLTDPRNHDCYIPSSTTIAEV